MPTFPVNSTASNSYPFVTKKEVAARLASDPVFCQQALLVLWRRQVEDERDSKTTKYTNKRGLSSSHAVPGSNLAEKITAEEELTPEETAKVCQIVSHYTKQLTAHYRAEQEVSLDDTERAKVKATFGV